MHSFISPKVERRISKTGDGVFAKEKILAGEVITDFSSGPGTYIDLSQSNLLFAQGKDYMLQVDDNLFFAALTTPELEDTDFINHSCEPNCGIEGSLQIVAMKEISAEEEITFDYCMSESSTDFYMRCMCGAACCRQLITGDDWKSSILQQKYDGYFSTYLANKILAAKKLLLVEEVIN